MASPVSGRPLKRIFSNRRPCHIDASDSEGEMYQPAEIVSSREGLSLLGESERHGEIVAWGNKGANSIVKPDVKLKCTKLVTAEKISLTNEKRS